MAKQEIGPLTESQREIMEIFWDMGEATVGDIHERVSQNREIARNTIQTLIVRLEEKGWLKHTEQGRKFLYSAAAPRTKSLGARVSHMIDRMFGGSPEQLVNSLLEYRGLSESELHNIRGMINQAESNDSPSPDSCDQDKLKRAHSKRAPSKRGRKR